jgi:hypothetical protein
MAMRARFADTDTTASTSETNQIHPYPLGITTADWLSGQASLLLDELNLVS